MKKHSLLIVSLLLFCCCQISAQSNLPEFGNFSAEEINMKECSFDKDADAVILFDDGFSYYDDEHHLITARRKRIKILTDRGIDEANIRIRFYSKDNFEYIQGISAISSTVNETGVAITSTVDRKSIFTEKEDGIYSSIKFAIPNVKAGSIIEYKYESIMKHYGGLKSWTFQSDIPTMRSCYLLQIIPNAEFAYVVQKKSNYPIIIRPIKDEGKIYFEMNNIPGLNFEPYMGAVGDYLQRAEFQLSGFLNSFGSKQNVNTTWRDLGYDLATDKELGGTVKKSLSPIDEVKALVQKETSQRGKMDAVYNYVRNNFTWNGYYSRFAEDGLKEPWDKKSGDAAEINLILLNLLQTFDIEAYPLLVAERDFGKVDTLYPFVEKFNKTAIYAIADDKAYVLDATEKFCPPGLTPFPLLNTYAFLIAKKKSKLFKIESPDAFYFNRVLIHAKLSDKGLLSGTVEIASEEYARQMRSEGIRKNEKDYIEKNLLKSHDGLGIDSFRCENLLTDSLPLMERFLFEEELNETGSFVLLNYNLFTGLEKTPFTKEDRFTNIDFGFPYDVNVTEDIELPANFKIDELPKNKTFVNPERNISLKRVMKLEGNHLNVRITFEQLVTVIPYQYYGTIQEYYKSAIEMLNEPVTIKLTK